MKPSLSLSLATTGTATGVSRCVSALSSTAIGGAVTASVIVAVLETLPSLSLTIYEIDETPIKPGSGVNVTLPAPSSLNVPSPAHPERVLPTGGNRIKIDCRRIDNAVAVAIVRRHRQSHWRVELRQRAVIDRHRRRVHTSL